jgi:hypothetical protein
LESAPLEFPASDEAAKQLVLAFWFYERNTQDKIADARGHGRKIHE